MSLIGIEVFAAMRLRNSSRASICCTLKREARRKVSLSEKPPYHSAW